MAENARFASPSSSSRQQESLPDESEFICLDAAGRGKIGGVLIGST